MKRPPVPVLVLSIAAVFGLLAFWLFATSPGAQMERDRQERREEAATNPGRAAPVVAVDALRVRETAAGEGVAFSGILEPVRFVVVGAEVEGRVVEVPAVEHDPVEAGAPLVRLDQALPNAAVARARASLESARAANDLAVAELARQQNLSERGVASDAEFERALSAERTSAGQVAESRAQLVEAQTRLDKTRIPAPFDAVVSKLDLEPGAYLRPGDPVAELVDLSEIEIEVGVGDRQVLHLRPGHPATLRVDVFPGETFAGEILRVGRAPTTRRASTPCPCGSRIPRAGCCPAWSAPCASCSTIPMRRSCGFRVAPCCASSSSTTCTCWRPRTATRAPPSPDASA